MLAEVVDRLRCSNAHSRAIKYFPLSQLEVSKDGLHSNQGGRSRALQERAPGRSPIGSMGTSIRRLRGINRALLHAKSHGRDRGYGLHAGLDLGEVDSPEQLPDLTTLALDEAH